MANHTAVHSIIHAASASAAAAAAAMAQLPGSDAPVLVGIQSSMIVAIAFAHGAEISKAAAAEMVLTYSATMVGRGVSQVLLGWIPGLGNAINAGTAAALTEAVGWAANSYFEEKRSAA